MLERKCDLGEKVVASAGNRTRAARVAGEHSTTEPPMLTECCPVHLATYYSIQMHV